MKVPTDRKSGRRSAPLSTLARATAGAGTVLLGSYLLSRLKRSYKRQARLDRLEAMLAELNKESAPEK